MAALNPTILALFGRQYGVASRCQLLTHGMSEHQITHLVTRKVIRRVYVGVYGLAGSPATFEGDCLAVSIVDPSTVLSHQTAGRLWGLRQMGHSRLHVTTSTGRNPFSDPRIRVHRSCVLDKKHASTRADGIRLTSAARTVFDLSGVLGVERLESAVEHALRLGLVTVSELHEVGGAMAARGRAGSGRFTALLASRPTGQRPVDSNHELVLARALVKAGLPAPVRQFAITLPNGITIHPDLAWPEVRLAVEFDHATWHSGVGVSMDDRSRDRGLRALSWDIERVSDRELRDRRPYVVREIVLMYHRRLNV